jgi:hypothetical protein
MLKHVRHSRLYLASPAGAADPPNALLKARVSISTKVTEGTLRDQPWIKS